MIKGIEHIGIAASDTTALANWYCETLGFRIVSRSDDTPPSYFVAAPNGTMLEIISAEGAPRTEHDPRDPGIRHICIGVEDFEETVAELEQKGVTFTGAVIDLPGGGNVLFFTDPEGNLLHLVHRPEPLV